MKNLIFIIALQAFPAFPQLTIDGVVQSKTGSPVSFAHVTISGTYLGTIANRDGLFKLAIPKKYEDRFLKASSIGYQTDSIRIKEGITYGKFTLKESLQELQAVTVYSVDHARKLVEEAITRIPENYPNHTEYVAAFRRESVYEDSSMTTPYYILESQLLVEKPSYGKNVPVENVQLMQSRKFEFKSLDSLYARFYGGSHLLYRSDLVARRAGPLYADRMDRFSYELVDTLYQDALAYFQVAFDSKHSGRGVLSIQEGSYAITKIERSFNREEAGSFVEDLASLIRPYHRINGQSSVQYSEQGGIWRLSTLESSSAFEDDRNKPKVYIHDDAIVTNYQLVNPDSLVKNRIELQEVGLHRVGVYDSTFWDGQSILLPDEQLKEAFSNPLKKEGESSNFEKFINVAFKLKSTLGVYYAPSPKVVGSVNYDRLSYQADYSTHDQKSAFGLFGSTTYKINDFSIGARFQFSFTEFYHESTWLECDYKKRIGQSSMFLIPAVSLGYQHTRQKIGTIQNPINHVSIEGKKFDSNKIDAFVEDRGLAAIPSLGLSFRSHKLFRYYLSGGYKFSLTDSRGLYLVEHQGLFRSTAFIPESDPSLTIQSTSPSLNKSQFIVNAGFVFNL